MHNDNGDVKPDAATLLAGKAEGTGSGGDTGKEPIFSVGVSMSTDTLAPEGCWAGMNESAVVEEMGRLG